MSVKHLPERLKYKTDCNCKINKFRSHKESVEHFEKCLDSEKLYFFSIVGKETLIEEKNNFKEDSKINE
jgi:hypothetical protein